VLIIPISQHFDKNKCNIRKLSNGQTATDSEYSICEYCNLIGLMLFAVYPALIG